MGAMASGTTANSERKVDPFASKRLQILLLMLMGLSLICFHEIIFKDQALTTNINPKLPSDRSVTVNTENQTQNEFEESKAPSNNWTSPQDPIRSWGCRLNETPLIFVHIGKAGGGTIRRRFAAAAQNYTRSSNQWFQPELDSHIYPLKTTRESAGIGKDGNNTDLETHYAKFCNSQYQHHRIQGTEERLGTQFEGLIYCNATTPIGRMRACPEPLYQGCLECDVNSNYCHSVYVGHNLLGSEIHWLPPRILKTWWKSQWAIPPDTLSNEEKYLKVLSEIEFGIETLVPEDKRWCDALQRGRPLVRQDLFNRNTYMWTKCSNPLAAIADGQFNEFWGGRSNRNKQNNKNYSPLYASLPVHRVTVLREPFSWLLSKYFWHSGNKGLCDDIASASLLTNVTKSNKDQSWGWAYEYLMTYLLYICGEDCLTRFELGIMQLHDMEIQAESNLLQAFSVVGLLEEIDEFYDMVDQRFEYIDMSQNAHIQGGRHSSVKKGKISEIDRCKKVYEREDFRNEFKTQLPVLATMDRLYKVAVKVNRFQKEEIQKCGNGL